MPDKKYDAVKKEIRSVLLTFREGVPLQQFLSTYKGLVGQQLPSRACGFSSDVAFLQSMPDVVEVTTGGQGRVHLTGIADKASQHIQKLVSKQRKARPNSKSNKRQPVRKVSNTSCHVRELTPFLPGPLRAEILQLMATFENGVTIPGLALAYRGKFDKYLPLEKGLDTLESLLTLIPELELKDEEGTKKVYPKNSLASIATDKVVSNENLLEKNLLNIHESGVPEDVLKDFQLILQKCSDGILSIHFPVLYENLTKKQFDLHSLGYNSLIDLVDELPHIFKRTTDPNNSKQWIILPANASVQSILNENSTVPSHKNLSPHREGIPADVSSPNLQFFPANLPEDLNLDKYVPIYISSILDPSQFWFHLETDEAKKKLEELEKDLVNFYNFCGDEYKMKTVDMAIGATCVIRCPDDNEWYRTVIKSIPNIDHVNVYFVDYGGRQNVPRKNVYYVRSKYHEFPACAFKAQLAGVKPPNNESTWTLQAQQRFIQLVNSILMAKLIPTDKETCSVYLCNTKGADDVYVHYTLIKEKLAESLQDHSLNNNYLQADVTCKDNGALANSESDPLSSDHDQSMLQSASSDACSKPNISTVRRKLSFFDQELSHNESNCSNFENQKSKRYVKRVELCVRTVCTTVMHIINIENKLFMSCGELCRHLWSDGTSNLLIQRLLLKEVEVPFLKLKEENNIELFKQCRWCKIPDMEELQFNNSNLILCPLQEALKVLNIFGHPCAYLRTVIQSEIKHFNPSDPIWNEFDYEEQFDWDDSDKEYLQELKTACLFDLKAKHEALRIKKVKLSRTASTIADEEIKRIQKLQNVIAKRMKQIEEICAQYP